MYPYSIPLLSFFVNENNWLTFLKKGDNVGNMQERFITSGTIAQNKKARFHYEILETLEAGIILTGGEVKSLRAGRVSIGESYISAENQSLFLINANIAQYSPTNRGFVQHNDTRPRELLLHRKELNKWIGAIAKKGQTAVPLELYFNQKGLAKIKIALCVGKNMADKREAIKKRDWNREKQRILAYYNNGKK